MKQVAKKSTTSVPQKVSAINHQPNGLIRESSSAKTFANVTSNVSSASPASEVINGINDCCNDIVPSNHSRASAAADTIQQQTVQRPVCNVTSASNLPVSSSLPTVSWSQTAARVENSKKMKDMPLPVKHASAVTTKPPSHAASVSVSSASDVTVTKSGAALATKPDVGLAKRSASPVDDKKCEVKKVKLDDVVAQSLQVEGRSQLSRKVKSHLCWSLPCCLFTELLFMVSLSICSEMPLIYCKCFFMFEAIALMLVICMPFAFCHVVLAALKSFTADC